MPTALGMLRTMSLSGSAGLPDDFRELHESLLNYEGDHVWVDLLAPCVEAEWFRGVRAALASVSRASEAVPYHSGDPAVIERSLELYALSRVRDVLLLHHQPDPPTPANGTSAIDGHPARTWKGLGGPSIEEYSAFFRALGCNIIREESFHPFFHEIVEVNESDDPSAKLAVTEHLWPTIMLGDLLIARGGVRVSAGSDVARRGVADRSVLHFEFRRRYRPTLDASAGWGSNSQWRTMFRRDYATSGGLVFHFDARVDARAPLTDRASDDPVAKITEEERVELTVQRCALRRDFAASLDLNYWTYSMP